MFPRHGPRARRLLLARFVQPGVEADLLDPAGVRQRGLLHGRAVPVERRDRLAREVRAEGAGLQAPPPRALAEDAERAQQEPVPGPAALAPDLVERAADGERHLELRLLVTFAVGPVHGTARAIDAAVSHEVAPIVGHSNDTGHGCI